MSQEDEIEEYAEQITSKDAPVPLFLKITYATLPFWGIFAMYYYWEGSVGWLDRGHWRQLQEVANTSYPRMNYIKIDEEAQLKSLKSKENL